MPDLTSTVLISVVIILTIVLIAFSVQIFFILRDFRQSLKNLDRILTNLGNVSEKIDETVTSAHLVTTGAKIVSAILSLIHKNESK